MKCNKCLEDKEIIYFYKKCNEKYRQPCKKCQYIKEKEKNGPKLETTQKKCTECSVIKSIDDFSSSGKKNKNNKNIKRSKCKDCLNKKLKELRTTSDFKRHEKEYRLRPEIKKNINNNTKKFRTNNEHERVAAILRSENSIIMNSIKNNNYKHARCFKLFGCSIEQLKLWFEFRFDDFMSWENYGIYWNVDHVKPLCSFTLSDKPQYLRCSNWINVQPLKIEENGQKFNKQDFNTKITHLLKLKIFMYSKNIKYD
jgi:hypothetical protein